jgi:hypothetical protein
MNPAPAGGSRALLNAARLATLAILLAHAWSCRFLCDDAFISFRYARNLSHGYGLVFNPGFERVEGFSNLLWTLLLSALDRVGLVPERVAIPIGLALTAALWLLVSEWMRRRWTERDQAIALVPLLFLALSRSVAVWATSGLETRLFELLVVAGLMRITSETEALADGRQPGPPLAAWLFGLAALCRPDGVLIGGCALAAASALAPRRPGALRDALARAWPWLALVAALEGFRLIYYGAWVPNTYYAKVGGRFQWQAGLEYVSAFALEYAAFLWVPLLALGVARLARTGGRVQVALFAAAAIPYGLYVIAIGGDHFEYRPLDLFFPLAALWLGEGLRVLRDARGGFATTVAASALILTGVVLLPWRAHAEFPRVYSSGFPGYESSAGPEAERYLDPSANPITRLPLLRSWAEAHRTLVRRITARFAGVRQEEHAMFLAQMREEGQALMRRVESGLLPRDLSIATDCVGAVPYLSGARTLDRLGLTDAVVAHQAFVDTRVAHGKEATPAYARQRGIDLWFHDPARLLAPLASSRFMRAWIDARQGGVPVYAADAGEGEWALAMLPLGAEEAQRKLQQLHLISLADSAASAPVGARAIEAWREKLRSDSTDTEAWDALGYLCSSTGRLADAVASYRRLSELAPRDPEPLENLGVALERLGDFAGAAETYLRAAEMREAAGDVPRGQELRAAASRLSRPAR